MKVQIDERIANKNATSGIQAAELNAEIKNDNWSMLCRQCFKRYLRIVKRRKNNTFMIEDFRKFAEGKLPYPPSNRAFGGVTRWARTEGLIKAVGYGKTKGVTAHGTPATIWEAL